jgi:AbrB family looped-hinge helix DNA binding protein
METTKLSSKGQVIIPKWLRDIYRWEAGLEFVVIDTGEGVLLKPNRPFDPTELKDVAGSLRYEGKALTVEEMEDGLRRGVREKWDDRR